MLRLVVERFDGPWDEEDEDQPELDERDEEEDRELDERKLDDERELEDRDDEEERELDERELDDRDDGGMQSPFPETLKRTLVTILVILAEKVKSFLP